MSFQPSSNDYEGNGMIVRKIRDYYVVYLYQIRRASLLDTKKYKGSFKLGDVIECYNRAIPLGAETMFLPFEVDGPPPRMQNDRNELKIVGNSCYSLFSFNLAEPQKQFKWWTKLSGQYVLESQHVGFIIMEEKVIEKSRQHDASDIIAKYSANRDATSMVGYCEYTDSYVPKVLFGANDENCQDAVNEWCWTLKEIVATEYEYLNDTEQTKVKNLGPNSRQIEEDDDIARQKRMAKAQQETDQWHYARQEEHRRAGAPAQGQGYGQDQYSQYPRPQYQGPPQGQGQGQYRDQYPNRGPQQMDRFANEMNNLNMGGAYPRAPSQSNYETASERTLTDRQWEDFAGPPRGQDYGSSRGPGSTHQPQRPQDYGSSSSRGPGSSYQDPQAPQGRHWSEYCNPPPLDHSRQSERGSSRQDYGSSSQSQGRHYSEYCNPPPQASSQRSSPPQERHYSEYCNPPPGGQGSSAPYRNPLQEPQRYNEAEVYQEVKKLIAMCEESMRVFWGSNELRRVMKQHDFDRFVDGENLLDSLAKASPRRE